MKQRYAHSAYALAFLMMRPVTARAEEARISPAFDARASLGLQTFQEAITAVGFHCPVVQTVNTEIDRAGGGGLPKFIHKVQCRELGSLDVNPKLTYRVQQLENERRFSISRW